MAASVSLEDLVALNDEIAGLVRSGVPLDRGLAAWSRDVAGSHRGRRYGAGSLARGGETLAKAVGEGQSLSEALARSDLDLPPVYRAVVTAGIRSGRLPSALEALSGMAGNLSQLRSGVGLALLYPLLLLLITYWLLGSLFTIFLPAVASFYEQDVPRGMTEAIRIGQILDANLSIPGTNREFPLSWLPPLVLVIGASVVWVRSRRAKTLGIPPAGRWFSRLPWVGKSLRHAHQSAVAQIFGLLIAHDVPLGEALVSTAECTGDAQARRQSEPLAGQLNAGRQPTAEELVAAGLPMPIASLVASGASQATLVGMADHVADFSRRQAASATRQLTAWFPVIVIALIGGVVGMLFCASFFLPFSNLLQALAGMTNSSLRVHP